MSRLSLFFAWYVLNTPFSPTTPLHFSHTASYLHVNGLIHRDIKAANLLIDDDGTVLLGDLGVAAPLWESSTEENHSSSKRVIIDSASFNRPGGGFVFVSPAPHHAHEHSHSLKHVSKHPHSHSKRALGKRKSFVGTPCWMAPEVITGKQYDASADIWSFGITALELAHGRAPYSRSSPSVAMTHIATSSAPKLDRTGCVNTYSAAFAEIVEMCLNKDPTKRPSAEELLSMSWFRGAKKKGYLVGTVLKGLPPLASRQERYRAPSLMTHATMESWDFAMTQVGSPTTSVYSARSGWRRRSDKVPEGEMGLDTEDSGVVEGVDTGVHVLDDEDSATYARRMRTRHHVRTGSAGLHSRARSCSVSLAESIHEDEEAQSSGSGSPPAPSQISEAVSKFASKLQQTQQDTADLQDVPETSSPSTSPSPGSSIGAAVTPPGSTHHDSVGIAQLSSPSVSGSGTGRLWKKLVGITGKGAPGRGTAGENIRDLGSKESGNGTIGSSTIGSSGENFSKRKSGLGSRVRRGLLST